MTVTPIDAGPPRRPGTASRRAEVFDDAVAVMEQRFEEQLTVAAVARAIGTSSRQLQRVFEEVGGTTFREHLAAVRMRHAEERLRSWSDTHTVAQVARSVGYNQAAQFAKAFRRHRGVAPGEVRRTARRAA